MTKRKNPHAIALGRKGGLASKGKTSPAKTASSRANLLKAREKKNRDTRLTSTAL